MAVVATSSVHHMVHISQWQATIGCSIHVSSAVGSKYSLRKFQKCFWNTARLTMEIITFLHALIKWTDVAYKHEGVCCFIRIFRRQLLEGKQWQKEGEMLVTLY
jgi:hypothetical protein